MMQNRGILVDECPSQFYRQARRRDPVPCSVCLVENEPDSGFLLRLTDVNATV